MTAAKETGLKSLGEKCFWISTLMFIATAFAILRYFDSGENFWSNGHFTFRHTLYTLLKTVSHPLEMMSGPVGKRLQSVPSGCPTDGNANVLNSLIILQNQNAG